MPLQPEHKKFSAQSLKIADRKGWLLQPLVHIGVILSLGLGLYLQTLHAPFIFDDYPCIIENPTIRNFGFFTDFDRIRELTIQSDIKNNLALRPVAYLTFALNYHLGGVNEFGYHLVNTAIHLINALLVYLLAALTLQRTPLTGAESTKSQTAGLIPFLVALLFVAHPLQIQAVTYISQRFTSLATLFYLAALVLYISARRAKRPTTQWIYYGLSLLITILAMKTKSIAFTLPIILLLYDLCFLDGRLRQRMIWLAPFFLSMVIIPGTLIWLVATDGVDDPRGRLEQSVHLVNSSGVSQWDYLRTQFGVIVAYLYLFLLPVGQNVIPDYPMAQSFFEPRIIGSFLLLLTLFVGAVCLGLRSFKTLERSVERLIFFGILWFFVTISISSSIIPLDLMMLEYRVYLPSFGLFFTVVIAATAAVDKGWIPYRTFLGAAVLIIVLLSAATLARNAVYTDKIRLLNDIIAKSPDRLEARVGLAYVYLEQERFDDAIAELTTILRAIPDDPNMNVNLGYALSGKGQTAEAISQYQKALAINPGNPHAHGNLGFEYIKWGRIADAEREMLISLELDPHFGAARYRLALLYEEQGRIDEAIKQYRELLNSYPGSPEAISRLKKLGRED